MPVRATTENGRPGYRWGERGAVYTYAPGDEAGRRRARAKAAAQGAAVLASRMDAAPPRPPHVDVTERKYTRRLLARVRAAKMLLDERLAPVLARIEARAAARVDAAVDPNDLAEILRVITTVRAAFAYEVDPGALVGIGEQVALFASRKLHDDYPTVFPISIARDAVEVARVAEWSQVNARLIKTIDSRYWDDVAEVAREAVARGIQTRELTALLQERYTVSESRAKLIARDQISKLNAKITEQKQTALGVVSYVWSTSHDERVRPTHRNLDGSTQRWDSPPVTETNGERNHPGQAIQCRCTARPVVPGYDRPAPARFETPTLTAGRPTIYGSRETPLSAKDRSDLLRRLGRTYAEPTVAKPYTPAAKTPTPTPTKAVPSPTTAPTDGTEPVTVYKGEQFW